ncbi:MAG: MBL fold metallo-hydrolase, partial [Clostridia bacterium]|nr:MBL fold metallo-hydrolase [Clostridia bacterium]
MRVWTLTVGLYQANCYLFAEGEGGAAVVIDPGDEAAVILQAIRDAHLKVERILLT